MGIFIFLSFENELFAVTYGFAFDIADKYPMWYVVLLVNAESTPSQYI